MDNPIPDRAFGIETITLILSGIGSAYALSHAEPMPPVKAGVYVVVAFTLGVLAGVGMSEQFPGKSAMSAAAAIVTAAIMVPLLPVLQQTAAENIRKLRFPWTKGE